MMMMMINKDKNYTQEKFCSSAFRKAVQTNLVISQPQCG